MMRCRRLLGIATVLLVGALLAAGCERIDAWLHPATCSLSHRTIHRGMAVELQLGGHVPQKACCLRCAITYSQQTGKRVRILSVTDYVSHKRILPDRALYLVGSNIAPCAGPPVEVPASRRELVAELWDRCLSSVLAFASREDAQRFEAEHGGTIETFAEVVGDAKVVAAE